MGLGLVAASEAEPVAPVADSGMLPLRVEEPVTDMCVCACCRSGVNRSGSWVSEMRAVAVECTHRLSLTSSPNGEMDVYAKE